MHGHKHKMYLFLWLTAAVSYLRYCQARHVRESVRLLGLRVNVGGLSIQAEQMWCNGCHSAWQRATRAHVTNIKVFLCCVFGLTLKQEFSICSIYQLFYCLQKNILETSARQMVTKLTTSYLMCICCTMCVLFLFNLNAGLLATGKYSEGPATGHLDTGFSWFPCAQKQCWDGSQDSKLPLHASRVAPPT